MGAARGKEPNSKLRDRFLLPDKETDERAEAKDDNGDDGLDWTVAEGRRMEMRSGRGSGLALSG